MLDSEDDNMRAMCVSKKRVLDSAQNAFIRSLKNKSTFTTSESQQLRVVWDVAVADILKEDR